MKTMYEASATAEAGRDGRVRSSDGRVDLALAPPRELGGSGEGTNPEQLFAAGYAACFHSAMLHVARGRALDLAGSSVEGHVGIGQAEDGRGFALVVRHVVRVPGLGHDEARRLVDEAHAVCPYSRAISGNVEVGFEVEAGR